MPACPACGRSYAAQVRFCTVDATALCGPRQGQCTPPLPAVEPGETPPFVLLEHLRDTPTGALHVAALVEGDREVLVKRVPPHFFPSPVLCDRALRELRRLQGAAWPGLLPVWRCGLLADGELYVLWSPLHESAEALDERVEREGPLPPDLARHVVLQVGQALLGALDRGVLHRNLAPYAVYLDDHDEAHLMDFGLSEFHQVGWRLVQGPLAFLSPEQAEGRSVTEQSLVWGLAALYRYLLTGAPLHRADSAEALLGRICQQDPPPVRCQRPELSEDIEALLQHALQRAPEHRPASLRELLDRLDRLSDILPTGTNPTPGWMLPSLGEPDDDLDARTIPEQVVDVSWLAVQEEPDEDDLHTRSTLPLAERRAAVDLEP
ncbi:MAG: protein kinase [Myxococcales bacterium]|nr:protein kinase [Myxococcota bacterium]MDW8283554.1 protein kinase [Myxococcales bacterium]